MDLRRVDPDDAAAVAAVVALTNTASALDAPWSLPTSQVEKTGNLRHGWDLEPSEGFLGVVDGQPVAYAEYATSAHDNLHLAWLSVVTHPDHRRRGHGSRVLEALMERARREGRTSVGIESWDLPGSRAFAEGHGFALGSVEVCRRQDLTALDRAALDAAVAEARPHASAYDLVRRAGRTPDDELDDLVAVTDAINDAPLDDLQIEDEVYDAARVRDYETAQLGTGHRLYRVLARHRATGELAGHTVVVVFGDRPEIGEQHDTTVVRTHRGHRLGLLVKADMVDWLAQEEPQLATIDTWNARSNGPMIDVNERLGYRVVGQALQFQRDL